MIIKQIQSIDFDANHCKIAYLQGVIMSNGEFISNGKCQFLKEEDKVFIEDKGE